MTYFMPHVVDNFKSPWIILPRISPHPKTLRINKHQRDNLRIYGKNGKIVTDMEQAGRTTSVKLT